jgi:hypothetical protein
MLGGLFRLLFGGALAQSRGACAGGKCGASGGAEDEDSKQSNYQDLGCANGSCSGGSRGGNRLAFSCPGCCSRGNCG